MWDNEEKLDIGGCKKNMIRGINVAKQGAPIAKSTNTFAKTTPCIFLSHIQMDQDIVVKIGDYIKKAGINIYLDVNDLDLQRAVKEKNDQAITEFIEKGISSSSHVMCILTENTKDSWWVPFEIGFGKNAGKRLLTMPVNTLSKEKIPSYIKVTQHIFGINALNSYLKKIIHEYNNKEIIKSFAKFEKASYDLYPEGSIIEESVSMHPLSKYFNQ
jgi:hypothetical protein